MDKLKIVDIFNKNCFIIKYIFCKNNSYPFNNMNILQFMLLKLLDKVKKIIDKLPKKILAIYNSFIKNIKATTI